MEQRFDPFFKWLGIPPDEQPPHYYRLLGLPPFVADLDVIENWRYCSVCICSVPNYDSPYHARYFRNEEQIILRYGKLLNISRITRIKKPYISNISFRNRLKQIRWNRYRPKQLLKILGFSSFSEVGGWFVFVGNKS